MSTGVELRANGPAPPLMMPRPRRLNTHEAIWTVKSGSRPSAEVLAEAFKNDRRDSRFVSRNLPSKPRLTIPQRIINSHP